MYPPHLLAQATNAISEASPVTAGLSLGLLAVGVAWGEARYQISGLREWVKAEEARRDADRAEIAALKAAKDVTNQRVDHVLELLAEVRADVKLLLQRGRDVA